MDKREASLFAQFLEPLARCLTPAVAEQTVNLRPDSATEERITELADKANEGELSDAERQEYSAFIEASDVIGIVQATARTVLARSTPLG